MPYASRRQQRWANATGQPFASRWNTQTSFASLPETKDDAAPLHGPGGLLATPGTGVRSRRRFKAAGYGARAGETIRGNLKRGGDGKFTSGGASSAARPADRLSRAAIPTSRPQAPKPASRRRSGGSGGGGKKAPKPTAAQRQAARQEQRDADQQANRARVAAEAGLGEQLDGALSEFGSPDEAMVLTPANEQALRAAGLVEGPEGTPRISQAGRGYLAARTRGDVAAARDAVNRGQELASRAAKPKGGGGGGGAKQKPTDDEKRQEQDAKRAAQASATARTVGLAGADLDALRSAAEGAGGSKALDALGLTSGGEATDQGRRALSALERGDVRGYRAALQDAKARLTREQAARERQTAAEAARQRAAREQNQAGVQAITRNLERQRGKTFAVFKDATGRHRWIARTTTAYRDRDREIITTKALEADAARMTATAQYGPLRYWHVGAPDPLSPDAPWGPGLDIGDCDFSTVIGRTSIESGTFKSTALGAAFAQTADQHELSPGFFHPLDQPNAAGEYDSIRRFERSLVPTAHARASNLFTGLTVKEHRMDKATYDARVKAYLDFTREQGVPPDVAAQALAGMETAEKEAQARGVAFKSADAPPDEITIGGVTYTLKAPFSPAEMDDGATEMDDGATEDVAEAAAETPAETPAAEMMDDEAFIAAIAAKVVELLSGPLGELKAAMGFEKKITDAIGEVKSMFGGVATKDDARAAELAALTAQQAELAGTVAALVGDQRQVVASGDIAAALKSQPTPPTDPNAPPAPENGLQAIAMASFPELYGIPPGRP